MMLATQDSEPSSARLGTAQMWRTSGEWEQSQKNWNGGLGTGGRYGCNSEQNRKGARDSILNRTCSSAAGVRLESALSSEYKNTQTLVSEF